jgi:pimeloyl-ACP methyl ester carboxylesterase
MAKMGIAKAVITGQSLGGAVALEFALGFPGQTAGLVLISSGGYAHGAKPGAFNPLRYWLPTAVLMSFSSYPAMVKSFFTYIYHDPAPFARDAALVEQTCDINRTPNARRAIYWMRRALDFDYALPDESRIRSVAVPTLIVWGREDRVVDIRTAERFHQDIAGSQLVVIDDAGQMVHEEKPASVNGAIASFVGTFRW